MKTISLPVVLAALAGVVALAVMPAAAPMLFLTAALGAIISVDYSQRYRGLRLPRSTAVATARLTAHPFRRPTEQNRLAA